MAVLGELWNAATSATNEVTNIINDFEQKQANIDLTNMQIQLEREVNAQTLELQKNNDYGTWEQTITDFYTKRMEQMGDKNSPYYCRNNYTARMAKNMLESSLNTTQNKAAVMAMQNLQKKDIATYNENISQLQQMYSGQEYINRANQAASNLYEAGILDPTQYASELEKHWYTGSLGNYTNNFTNDIISKGIADGESFDEVWNKYDKSLEKTKRYGSDGLEVSLTTQKLRQPLENNASSSLILYSLKCRAKTLNILKQIQLLFIVTLLSLWQAIHE